LIDKISRSHRFLQPKQTSCKEKQRLFYSPTERRRVMSPLPPPEPAAERLRQSLLPSASARALLIVPPPSILSQRTPFCRVASLSPDLPRPLPIAGPRSAGGARAATAQRISACPAKVASDDPITSPHAIRICHTQIGYGGQAIHLSAGPHQETLALAACVHQKFHFQYRSGPQFVWE
jgi:hypothetical protein